MLGDIKLWRKVMRSEILYLSLWLAVTWPGCCTWLHTFVVHPRVQPMCAYNHRIQQFQAQCLRAVSSAHAAQNEATYRELCVGAWVCVWSAGRGCGCLGIADVSPAGRAVMGGRTGREQGNMYSDSSSLSRASSPVTGLMPGEGLGRKWICEETISR